MRIGIDFRLLSGGALTVHRGMGRYSRQQLREVLRLGSSHHHVLFCREDAEISALPPEAFAPNVEIAWLPPLSWARRGWERPDAVLRLTEELQGIIDERQVDVFHLTTPCDLDDFVPFSLDGPLVANHYDLIPAAYPRHYYRELERRALYERALRTVRGAERLVAISRYSAREATAFLGVPPARIRVAYPVADPVFRPVPEAERERILSPLRERLGLPGGFFLTVSHLHHAKNLCGLLDAWRLLPVAVRRESPLVLACELNPADAATVRGWAAERGIAESVLLTGFLADEELAALYNAATVYVHPSRSEGFGLPVLEAMRCGAAVAATAAGSLPEVLGEAGVQFDPEDPAAIARALEVLRLDPGRRRELGALAVERAAGFRAEDLGLETLAAYEEAAAGVGRPRRAPRLALWAPVPPQESGIADYSQELLGELVRRADVEVFTDDGAVPGPEMADLAPVRAWTAFARRGRMAPFDAVLYQLGASFFHFYMTDALRDWPGIVTLHDLTWGALIHRARDVWGDREDFLRELEASEGEAAAAEYRELTAGSVEPAVLAGRLEDFFNRHPLLGGVLASSLAAIIHLPRAAAELADRYPEAEAARRLFTFPMGVEDPRLSLPAAGWNDLRPRLGITAESFVLGVFGVADPVKRLEAVVRALARLADEAAAADPVLLIAGSFPDPAYRVRVERLAADLGAAARVRLLGRTSRRDFDLALLACDVVVNLRYPFRHQMSATLMRAIAAGKPVVVTGVAAWDHFPAAFCLRVAPEEGDEKEAAALAGHLLGLARDPERRRQMGEAARRFWEENATPARMADGYLRVLHEVTGRRIEEPDPMSERGAPRSLPFNTAGAPDDFADPGLRAVVREVFPSLSGDGGREHWRGAMAVRALRELGALGPAAEVLCVRAGAEMPVFHLTGLARRVTAVDRYLAPAAERHPGPLMLTAPDRVCPLPFAREKLTVLAMDGRVLWLPDGAFNAIYAPEVERFGSREEIAAALHEMGRVLAPGGVLALAAALRVSGAAGAALAPDELRRWVIAASGLEPVDEPDFDVPETTLTAPRRPGGLVAAEDGSVSVPVALALRKTERYAASGNAWARPSGELRVQVRAAEADAASHFLSFPPRHPEGEPREPEGSGRAEASTEPKPAAPASTAEDVYRRWDAVRARTGLDAPSSGGRVGRSLGFLRRTAGRVRDLGTAADLQRDLFRALLDRQTGLDERLGALDDLGSRIAALEAELARSAAETGRSLDELRLGGSSGLATLRDRQETLRARQARLEGAMADLRDGLASASASGAGSPGGGIPLSAADFAALLPVLDDGSAGAVEVSFQDSRAESLLLAARRHFGGRLSSAGPSYRSPNDLWLHADFTAAWNRPILLENAAARLAPGGRFLLITAVSPGEPPRHPALQPEEERVVTAATGAAVRVLGWRR